MFGLIRDSTDPLRSNLPPVLHIEDRDNNFFLKLMHVIYSIVIGLYDRCMLSGIKPPVLVRMDTPDVDSNTNCCLSIE